MRSESILTASLACFADDDYENVTIPLIAKRIGVTHSLIYYYFKNKNELYQSAILHALCILMSRYKKLLLDEKNPINMIKEYLDVNVEMSDTLRSLVRIIFLNSDASRANGPRFIDSFIEDFYDIEKTILAHFVQKGIDENIFTCLSSEEFASFISRNIDGIYYGSFMPHGETIPVAMEYLKNIVFKLLCGEGLKGDVGDVAHDV